MTKNPLYPFQPGPFDQLPSAPQQPGMFGRRGPRQDERVPGVPSLASFTGPFGPPASGLGPNAIDALLAPRPGVPPINLGSLVPTAGSRALNPGLDAVFSRPATAPSVRAPTSHRRQPPPEAVAAAQASQRATGVPASASLAQWIYESGWGKHIPKDSNNFFGVKEPNLQKPGVVQDTEEADPKTGAMIRKSKRFRVYASPEDSWNAHARLLSTDRRYAKAMTLIHDPDAFIDAIAGTYAPHNRHYAPRIKGIMKSNQLYQYDLAPHDK